MVVAKRQGREKPEKIEQKKVQGPEWGLQVEQIILLANPIYIGQAQGEEKNIEEEEPKGSVCLSLPRAGEFLCSRLWVDMPSRLEDGFSYYYPNKIEL